MNHVLLFGMPGGGELFFIVLVVIMLFGSKKIPELARGLGKGMREIKNATDSIQKEIKDGAKDMNISDNPLNIKKQVTDLLKEETPSQQNEQKENFVDKTKEEEPKPVERNTTTENKSQSNPIENNNPSQNS